MIMSPLNIWLSLSTVIKFQKNWESNLFDKLFLSQPGCYGNTSDVSSNTFSGDRSDATVSQEGGPEDGKRIDYIFYQSSQRSLECTHCEVTMGHVPGKTFSFSDHEGVAASFVVTDTMADETGKIISTNNHT